MRQREIARTEKVTDAFVSRLVHGKQLTKKISLAKKVAAITGKKPIAFIVPEFREALLKAYPDLGKLVKNGSLAVHGPKVSKTA